MCEMENERESVCERERERVCMFMREREERRYNELGRGKREIGRE